MWNEKIFSAGDLSYSREEYIDFIETDYSGDYLRRREHIERMINRLQNEITVIRDIIASEDIPF